MDLGAQDAHVVFKAEYDDDVIADDDRFLGTSRIFSELCPEFCLCNDTCLVFGQLHSNEHDGIRLWFINNDWWIRLLFHDFPAGFYGRPSSSIPQHEKIEHLSPQHT